MTDRDQLVSRLDEYLAIDQVDDLAPNGLQVEGAETVRRVALGVTSSLALIEKAVRWDADALIVHHGLFWRHAGDVRVVRSLRSRLKLLIDNDINLLAYHLPLDRHMEVGNSAVLARRLEATKMEEAFLVQGSTVGVRASFDPPLAAAELFDRVARITGRDPLIVAGGPESVRTLGIVTGAAPKLLEPAIRAGFDAYLTGEPNEPSTHLAREEGIHFIAAGHHATERFGVQAVGELLEREFDIETRFFEINNPV